MPSGKAVWDLFVEGFGPIKVVAVACDEKRRQELERDFVVYHDQFCGELGVAMPREYLVAIGTGINGQGEETLAICRSLAVARAVFAAAIAEEPAGWLMNYSFDATDEFGTSLPIGRRGISLHDRDLTGRQSHLRPFRMDVVARLAVCRAAGARYGGHTWRRPLQPRL
jgi:hypothetical protein